MGEKSKEKEEGKDSFSRYFSDMRSFRVLDRDQEVEAFKEIEKSESDILSHFLSNSETVVLLQHLELECTNSKDFVSSQGIVQKQINEKQLLPEFFYFIRFTDIGRSWFENGTRSLLTNKSAWSRKLKQLYRKSKILQNKFAESNLKLVVVIAKKYHKSYHTMTLNDIIQEGNMGLMKAIERFDVNRGFKFSTYSVWWIRHFIKRSISEKDSLIRVPVHLSEDIKKFVAYEIRHLTQTGNQMTEEELAKISDSKLSKIKTVAFIRPRPILSLDRSVDPEGEVPWVETLTDDSCEDSFDKAVKAKMASDVVSWLSYLTPHESRIIRWRFGLDNEDPLTLNEIAEKFNLTRERIRQIEFRALQKLKTRNSVRAYARSILEVS